MLANPLSPLGCHNQHCAASGLCSFCSGVCGGGRVLFDGNTLTKSCQPVFFLDVCPAGKLVAVQTTPPEALGMCDVQHSHCSCLPWSLQPVRDAGGGGRSVTPQPFTDLLGLGRGRGGEKEQNCWEWRRGEGK